MPDAPPFDRRFALVGTYPANRAALELLVALMRRAYTTADFTSAVASLESLGTQHELGRLAESFVALWRAQLQRLGRSRSAPFGLLDALPTGLHPLLEACFRDDDDGSVLDDAQWVWFTQGGRARSRAPPSRPSSVVSNGEGTSRDRSAGGKGRGESAVDHQSDATSTVRGQQESGTPPPRQSEQRQASPRTPNPELGFEGDDDEDEDDGGEGGNFGLGDAPPPNGSYLARIAAAVGALAGDGNTSFHLPDDVAAVHRAQQRRRLDLADRATKADFTQLMRLITSSLQLAYEDVLSIALGEYISFTTLRDSRLGSAHDVPEHLRVVYHLEERRSKPRTPPLDPYQWCRTFDTLERVLRIVNVGEPFEEARQRRAAAYREFIDLELGRATSDAMRQRIVDYDAAVRSEMARPVKEALRSSSTPSGVASADPLRPPTPALFPALAWTPSRATAGASSTGSRTPTASGGTSARPASAPGSTVGTAITLVVTLLALPAANGAVRAEEEDLAWAPEGIVYGADAVADGGLDDAAPTNRLAGISAAPRLLRAFPWPSPTVPPPPASVDRTPSLPPLPRPPAVASRDPTFRRLRLDRPDLFDDASPLRADAFAAALADHPNQAWVASLVISIREGFWPGHDASVPRPPKPVAQSHLFSRDPADQAVLVENARAGVEAKLISPAFDVLPEGCVVSPQFVVRRDGSAPRVVDDHSASGLNDGIGEAAAMYDRLDALVAVLRYSGLVGETLPDHAVLYKLDVSAAFKLLPMSPEWQMRQAILVPYRDASGELRPRYHLQWRAAFGSRASPSLWTNLIAAVGWIVRKRNSELVPWPLTYMDDAFGVDLSGRTSQVAHDGEVREVPAAQAAIIAVWDELGLAWKWKKALHGRRLTITGIVVDLDDYSLSLEPEAVDKFSIAAASFLATSDRQPPLRHWRQLAGWANWALTVRPWARPLLSPLFSKLGRASSPYSKVFINRAVKDSLAAFVAELETGAPLDLRDPALTRWDEKEADIVLHTDACLVTTENPDESGLGFWTRTRTGPLVFSARPRVKYRSIQFAEGLAVYSAIDWALRKRPSARRWSKEGDEDRTPYRILVRTDSAPAVYAFDAGGTNQPDLAHLVRLAYADLRAAKVDLRIVHIRGKHNVTADRLSREPVASLIDRAGALPMSGRRGEKAVSFAPSLATRAPKRSEPWPPNRDLQSLREEKWQLCVAKSTADAYARWYRAWAAFALHYGHPLFPTRDSLSLYVIYRGRSVVPTTIASDLSGLAFFFSAADPKRWAAVRDSAEVVRAIAGNAKSNPHVPRKAVPLDLDHLLSGIALALASPSYTNLLWSAVAALTFLSCARAQEVTEYDNVAYRDARKRIMRDTVRITAKGFSALLPYHKADPLYTGSMVWFAADDAGDLFNVVRLYLKARDSKFPLSAPLWLAEDGVPPPRQWFVDRVQLLCGIEYTGHSFRAGGATFYALRGASDFQIKQLGRWKGNSFESYIRMQPDVAIALRVRDAGGDRLPAPSLPDDLRLLIARAL
ncbi:hypothetical protein JCM1840_002099 [Sporobolomyces johnsonii]